MNKIVFIIGFILITQIFIYNVNAITINDERLEAYYKFDEGSGNTVIDWAGFDNNLTIYDGDSSFYWSNFSVRGGSVYMLWNDVALLDYPAFNFTTDSDLTVCWWQCPSSSVGGVAFSQWDGVNPPSGFGCYSDGNIYIGDGSGWSTISHSFITDTEFHFYSLVINNEFSFIRWYVDGVFIGANSLSGISYSIVSTDCFSINSDSRGVGASHAGGSGYNGWYDDFMIFNSALSIGEINDLMINSIQEYSQDEILSLFLIVLVLSLCSMVLIFSNSRRNKK